MGHRPICVLVQMFPVVMPVLSSWMQANNIPKLIQYVPCKKGVSKVSIQIALHGSWN